MTLSDLAPYFELFKKLKENGEDIVLHEELREKEKTYIGKELNIIGVVNEIDKQKNELISTYKPQDNKDRGLSIKKLIGSHFFIFAYTPELSTLIQENNIEKDDLVQLTGTILSLHRHSVLRIALISVSILEKKHSIIKPVSKKGCFVATAVYGGGDTAELRQFYAIRDQYLSKYFAGRLFIRFYYAISPGIAKWIENKPKIKSFVRRYILDRILKSFNKSGHTLVR
jgi:hypothetical protein